MIKLDTNNSKKLYTIVYVVEILPPPLHQPPLPPKKKQDLTLDHNYEYCENHWLGNW